MDHASASRSDAVPNETSPLDNRSIVTEFVPCHHQNSLFNSSSCSRGGCLDGIEPYQAHSYRRLLSYLGKLAYLERGVQPAARVS